MANPMAALAVKAGVELANDKRLRTFAASAIVGLIVILLVPFLALVSIANAKAGYSQGSRGLCSMAAGFRTVHRRNLPGIWRI